MSNLANQARGCAWEIWVFFALFGDRFRSWLRKNPLFVEKFLEAPDLPKQNKFWEIQKWFTKTFWKNSPNTTYPCLCIFLHITTILIIKRLTCSCTLECLLGLYFLAHSPSSDLYFPNTSPEYLIFFYHHRARNNIQTRPPIPIYISKHVTRS